MKSKIIVLGLFVVFFCVGYVSAEETEEKDPVTTETSESVVHEETEEAPKYCPICGPEEEMHGLALGYKYKGKKYTFCSMGCLKAFKKDPEKFLKEKQSTDEDSHVQEGDYH